MDKLSEQEFEQEQEAALAKLRMEITRENEYSEMTQEEIIEAQEIEAKTRQVYDPSEKVYDSRRRRVTDLKECARITLPRPLNTQEEAMLETRKRSQKEIFNEYINKNTNKNGEQVSNLTKEEQEGLESLRKRIEKRELIVMKTDKSSKFAVTTEEEYLRMGQEHTKNDREVTRSELIEIEETINGHTRAWTQIWNSGQDHKHTARIMNSKVTHSENIADLYLMYKDHKNGNKTRPTATGHASNTLGMSNAVAEVLEAVSNSETSRYNTISSEDMLARIDEYNELVRDKNRKYLAARMSKLRCKKCKLMEYVDCTETEKHNWEQILQDKEECPVFDSEGSCTVEASKEIMYSECCGDKIQIEMRTDCPECGPGVRNEDNKYSIVGTDVTALYPSITSENTGRIIRRRIRESKVKFQGFCWRRGAAYIRMNENLTTDLEEIEHLLPSRKSKSKTELKMSAIPPNWDPENKFEYRQEEITPEEEREILARVVEIGTRMLFQNHVYRFGGQIFKQEKGGSIGDRWTGAAAEMVMQDWAENYREILTAAGIDVLLLAGYVDDGRQGTSTLPIGYRYNIEKKEFEYNKEYEMEDKRKRMEGESDNQRMARICLDVMNSINPDLCFTVECQEEYQNERLPTLDFNIWQEEEGTLNHSYFQKGMKTPLLISARSGMGGQQKIQILANELTRRIYNINKDKNGKDEYVEVIERMTQELKNSEYKYSTARQVIVSGIRGWKTRLDHRRKKGQEVYRLAKKTVKQREKKKILDRENWYKKRQEMEEGKETSGEYKQTKREWKEKETQIKEKKPKNNR